jgi:hypothetical protein
MQSAQAGAKTGETLRARIGGACGHSCPVLGVRRIRARRGRDPCARCEREKTHDEERQPEQPPR